LAGNAFLYARGFDRLRGHVLSGFCIHLHDSVFVRRVDKVSSFVGEDASGRFGLRAGHVRFMTCLEYGLCRFSTVDGVWHYLAIPGGVLYFFNNVLSLYARRYFLDTDYERILETLEHDLMADERNLETIRQSIDRLEKAVLQRIIELGKGG